jgi:hypothetical protein
LPAAIHKIDQYIGVKAQNQIRSLDPTIRAAAPAPIAPRP